MFSSETKENPLFELVCQRRSVRRYTGEKVSDDVVREILKIALLAPSSWGRHPVEFVVIRDRDTIEAVARCKRMGACWIHMRNRQGQRKSADEEIRQILGVPDKFSVLNVVALGQKGEKKSPRTEKDLVWQNVHYGRYGQK